MSGLSSVAGIQRCGVEIPHQCPTLSCEEVAATFSIRSPDVFLLVSLQTVELRVEANDNEDITFKVSFLFALHKECKGTKSEDNYSKLQDGIIK